MPRRAERVVSDGDDGRRPTLVLGNVAAQTSRAGSGVSVRLPGTTGGQSAAAVYANGLALPAGLRYEPLGTYEMGGRIKGTPPGPTLDDRWVEPTEVFTVTITVPADALIKDGDTA